MIRSFLISSILWASTRRRRTAGVITTLLETALHASQRAARLWKPQMLLLLSNTQGQSAKSSCSLFLLIHASRSHHLVTSDGGGVGSQLPLSFGFNPFIAFKDRFFIAFLLSILPVRRSSARDIVHSDLLFITCAAFSSYRFHS